VSSSLTYDTFRPSSPTAGGTGFKSRTVWVRVPRGARWQGKQQVVHHTVRLGPVGLLAPVTQRTEWPPPKGLDAGSIPAWGTLGAGSSPA
jgi:hypothetical protein